MGMYTEIYVSLDFKRDTPQSVLSVVHAICEQDRASPYLTDKPGRWWVLFNNGSHYHALTSCGMLTFNAISGRWSLLGKGDLKNYEDEIQEFFEFIKPWCADEGQFIGYYRYETAREPTLVYAPGEWA